MRQQRGFTLLEISVVLIVLSAITMLVLDNVGPWINYQSRLKTEQRLEDLKRAFGSAYRANIGLVDSQPDAVFRLPGGDIVPTPISANGVCQSTDQTLRPLAGQLPAATAVAARDGSGAPLCFFITPRQSTVVEGISVTYRTVAVASPGINGSMEAGSACTTGISATGQATRCGDDEIVVVDGLSIALEAHRATVQRMERIVKAYEAYFAMRYQSDPARNVAVNYFAAKGPGEAERWDLLGSVDGSDCVAGSPVSNIIAAIGLAASDVIDAYGNVFLYDTCSSAVRSPGNATLSMTLPPYTAAIQTTLPDGTILRRTAVGAF